MNWEEYWAVLRRRWWIVAIVVLIDVLVSGYLFAKSYRHIGSQACLTLYVSDIGAPSLVAVPTDLLDTVGQQLAGETAANFFADDILDISQGGQIASFMGSHVARLGLPNAAPGDLSVSGSRKDRTVTLCVNNPSASSALAAGNALAAAWTSERTRFMGSIGKRVDVMVITQPSVGSAPVSHGLVSLALRLILGLIVAVGLALLWDALDPARRAPSAAAPPTPGPSPSRVEGSLGGE